ncbi:MAG: cyclic nucleotide-binding domain-containing protein [Acidobacteriota bacterium]
METLEPLLAAHPFFKNLEESFLKLITGCASNVRFEAGEFIGREGANADHFYLIRHGQVSLQVASPSRGAMVVQTIGEGEILGWSWLVPPYRWTLDVQAITLTRAIALDGKCIRAKCEENHDLGYELLKRFTQIMVQRLEATRIQLLDIYGTHA